MTLGHLTLVALVTLANLALGSAILFKNPKNAIHRHFALFSFCVAAWTVSNGFVSMFADTIWGCTWGRLTFAFASFIPVSFLFFAAEFPTPHPAPPPRIVKGFLLAGLVAFITSLTPLMVRGTASVRGSLQVHYGPLHFPYALYLLSCLGYSFYILTGKVRRLTGIQKLQVQYLFAGVLSAAVGATIVSLIIPIVFATSQFSRYGPLFGLLMIAVIAHTIIRYRLMDIKLVIRRGVAYVCAIVASASVFFLFAQLLRLAGGLATNIIPLGEALFGAVTIAILFQPLKNWIHRSLNRYFYREIYDYQRTIRDASRQLSTMLELDPLLDYLAAVIETTFKSESVNVYLQDQSGQTFVPRQPLSSGHLGRSFPSPISRTSPLIRFLQLRKQPLVRDEVIRDARTDSSLAIALNNLAGDIVFPLLDHASLVGVIVVGTKRSGDPYFADDIDLLETLIAQASVATKNAQLYRQVVLVNEYVDNILSTMDSGVIAVNASGTVSLFNRAAERLTGSAATTAQGAHYTQLPVALAAPLAETLGIRESRSQFETSISGADGTTTPLVCSTAVLRHRDGSIHGALIVFSDLTRIKDLERENRRAERLASFGALASGVAHEIKNPLVAIRTFAELLPERFMDTDFREDFAQVVIREIGRIDDLVARLRGIAATAPQQQGTTDLREPLTEILKLLRAQAEQTRTTVRCDFQDDSELLVAVEEAQIKQLFLNILLNAIEAMGSDGQLNIRVSRKELRNAQWIVAEVADTGPGIPDPVRTHIFDPFFTTKPRGSGLGLAICRGIVDAHRGAIRAESRVDRPGTVIVVELPAATPHSHAVAVGVEAKAFWR